MSRTILSLALAGSIIWPAQPDAAGPIRYRFTFPELQHRWMQVEATFPDLPAAPLEVRMSRSSPGRYSTHDFAKNVYDVHAFGADLRELPVARPDPQAWVVADHGGAVTVKYKVYGDRVDGTYLGIDTTHAHINMPAAIMWARGLDDRPSTLVFEPPSGSRWQVATQLQPGATPLEFTAPNLQYLMDSPVELGPIAVRQFSLDSHLFRFAAHHTGTDADLDALVKDVQRLVRQEGAIFGEYPDYETGAYTFLADYLPYATGDGMEHRNSTVMTARGAIRTDRSELLDTVAHEFFHGWNVERIRPRSLEPFDFDRPNVSGELWLAEGFTQYYGLLALQRASLADLASTSRAFGYFVDAVTNQPGRRFRSAIEMSQMAPFTDNSRPVDRTDWSNTVVSYYTYGGALALALDLSLREGSDGRLTLDDYMRAMWRKYGKPGGSRAGYVDRPYTLADAEATLADVSGNRVFAREFFGRYIEGRDLPDYGRLLARAGLLLRKSAPGRAWWGDVHVDTQPTGAHVAGLVPAGSPAYAAGVEQDDVVQQVDGVRVASGEELNAAIARHKPGDRLQIVFVDRGGVPRSVTLTLAEDPHLEIVPEEASGAQPTASRQAFRQRWLGPRY